MAISDIEWLSVPIEAREEAKKRHSTTREDSPIYSQLMKEGETIFFKEAEPKKLAGLYQSARVRGYSMSLRQTEVDSVKGCLVWWDKQKEENDNG